MNFSFMAESIPFEYYIIRNIVLKYLPIEKIDSLEYKFLYPFEKIDKQNLSLTDRIDPNNQIRFYLLNRTFRIVSELAKKISETGIKEANFYTIELHSPLKNHFVSALLRMNVVVQFTNRPENNFSPLTLNEIAVIKEILKGENGNITLIQDAIKKVINSGDIFTAETLLEHGMKNFIGFDCSHANIIGTIKNCMMKPLEAEYYYNLSKIDQIPLSIVKANYPLSMLYLRHHKFNKLNLEKGKKYLEDAFSIIKSGALDYLDETEKQFYTVFNRNGYGLVLFKEGKEKKAIDLLNWGIKTLAGVEDKHYMHKSVIIYNICQCYKKLMQYDKAIEKYQELLEIDYIFTEYHIEMGLCMQLKGDLPGFKICVEQALTINPYHSDSHYHYSLIKLDEDDLSSAEYHAKMAWELSSDDVTAYNYAYVQSLTGKYDLLSRVCPTHHSQFLSEWFILQAERACQKSISKGVHILTEALNVCPGNQHIINNIEYIKSAIKYD